MAEEISLNHNRAERLTGVIMGSVVGIACRTLKAFKDQRLCTLAHVIYNTQTEIVHRRRQMTVQTAESIRRRSYRTTEGEFLK